MSPLVFSYHPMSPILIARISAVMLRVCVMMMLINPSLHTSHEPRLRVLTVDPWYPVQCLTHDGHTINICQMNK